MDITEFLEARIAEDEAVAQEVTSTFAPDAWYNTTETGNFYPEEIAFWDRQTPARVLAECAAKRAIIHGAKAAGDDGYYSADYMPTRKSGPFEAGNRRIYPGHPSFMQAAIWSLALRHLAAVYKDHPDYQQEWAI